MRFLLIAESEPARKTITLYSGVFLVPQSQIEEDESTDAAVDKNELVAEELLQRLAPLFECGELLGELARQMVAFLAVEHDHRVDQKNRVL